MTTSSSLSNQLRNFMRHVAQPVAVVSAHIPQSKTSTSTRLPTTTTTIPNQSLQHNHGATLSSFTSVALNPVPLVSFSLQMPSRLANHCLESINLDPTKQDQSTTTTTTTNSLIKVHLLSTKQKRLAQLFARQLPCSSSTKTPALSSIPSATTEFEQKDFDHLQDQSIGHLTCRILHSVNLGQLEQEQEHKKHSGSTSQLFIAKVEDISLPNQSREPLLHYDRHYYSLGQQLQDSS